MAPPRNDNAPPRAARRFLVGATASGKSAVATEIALQTAGTRHTVSLISMDSMLVYRGLDIVTAKPDAQSRATAPLSAVDLVDPGESFSVAKFLDAAERAETEILDRGAVPLFVGGTGLYLRALTHGLFEGPPSDLGLRATLSARARKDGIDALYADLQAIDPDAAAKIHMRDEKRIIRALEVFAATGERISKLQRQWTLSSGFPRIIVGLNVPKECLQKRIEARVDAMLDGGVSEEIARFQAGSGFSREALAAVGVREVLEWNAGASTREACRAAIIKRTRELARRQGTWFRSYPEIRWVEVPSDMPVAEIATEVIRILELHGR